MRMRSIGLSRESDAESSFCQKLRDSASVVHRGRLLWADKLQAGSCWSNVGFFVLVSWCTAKSAYNGSAPVEQRCEEERLLEASSDQSLKAPRRKLRRSHPSGADAVRARLEHGERDDSNSGINPSKQKCRRRLPRHDQEGELVAPSGAAFSRVVRLERTRRLQAAAAKPHCIEKLAGNGKAPCWEREGAAILGQQRPDATMLARAPRRSAG